ncbi:MAG: FecR domain-containing protein [Bacteroidales bacterium]|nr:FecR domain-containing protein [Bacteroidales bacterium]
MTTSETRDLLEQFKSGRIAPDGMERLCEMAEREHPGLEAGMEEEWSGFEGYDPLGDDKEDILLQGIASRMWKARSRRLQFIAGTAAAVLLGVCLFMGAGLWRKGLEIKRLASQETSISSAPESSSEVVLPDGSKVILNARSSLSYKNDFGMKDRKVSLSGEAYFIVASSPEGKRFIVTTDCVDIQDIGTEFNVYSYPEMDIIETSLIKGKAKVTGGRKTVTLSPGEKAVYFRSSGQLKSGFRTSSIETEWMEENLVFIHRPLSEVFNSIERKFGVKIHYPQSVNLSDQYTGTFSDHRVSAIMDILKMHYGFGYRVEDAEIFIE